MGVCANSRSNLRAVNPWVARDFARSIGEPVHHGRSVSERIWLEHVLQVGFGQGTASEPAEKCRAETGLCAV